MATKKKRPERPEIPIEDLVVGEYYHCDDPDYSIEMVFIYDGRKNEKHPHRINKIEGGDEDRILTKHQLIPTDKKYQKDGALWYTGRAGRLATQHEKIWLNMCIAKNGFVEKPTPDAIDGFISNLEKKEYLDIEDTVEKPQKELVFEDFYQGQKFKGIIYKKHCEGLVTIEDDRIYLCQNSADGDSCKDKQGFTYSYTISISRKNVLGSKGGFSVSDLLVEKPKGKKLADSDFISNMLNMEIKDKTPVVVYIRKEHTDLEHSDFYTGQRFEATIRESFCTGEVYVDPDSKRVFLCQDKEAGDTCKDKRGFEYSYAISDRYDGTQLFVGGGIVLKDLKIEKPWTVELQKPAFLATFSVYLSDIGSTKLEVVKTIKDYTELGLKEAKDLVDAAGPFSDDVLLKNGMSKEDAEEFKNQLEFSGAEAIVLEDFVKLPMPTRVEDFVKLPMPTRVYASLTGLDLIDPKIKWSDPTEYFAVLDLEDKSDDRLFNDYIEDLSFIGFSKLGGHPIFKVRDNDLTAEELFTKVFSKIVSEMNASLMPLHEDDLEEHLEEIDMPVK